MHMGMHMEPGSLRRLHKLCSRDLSAQPVVCTGTYYHFSKTVLALLKTKCAHSPGQAHHIQYINPHAGPCTSVPLLLVVVHGDDAHPPAATPGPSALVRSRHLLTYASHTNSLILNGRPPPPPRHRPLHLHPRLLRWPHPHHHRLFSVGTHFPSCYKCSWEIGPDNWIQFDGKCVPTKTMWVAVFPYGPGFARAALRSGSRALARVALASLALATLSTCA
jgi:hypothetical protein